MNPAFSPADLLTEKTHLLIQSREVVGLTHWLLANQDLAKREGRVLAIVTRHKSGLTVAAARFIHNVGATWIVDHPEGPYDGFSGLKARWDGNTFHIEPPLHPAYLQPFPDQEVALHLNAETLHSYSGNPALGNFSQAALEAAGFSPATKAGIVEPHDTAFSIDAVTEDARKSSPKPRMVCISGIDGDGVLTSIPQPTGVIERVEYLGQGKIEPDTDTQIDILTQILASGASYVSLASVQGRRGRLVDANVHHQGVPIALAVPASAMPHTTVDNVVDALNEYDHIQARAHTAPTPAVTIHFHREGVPLNALIQAQQQTLRTVLTPEEVARVKPWYENQDEDHS